MKKLLRQRFLACALAVCLLLGALPTTAMAASTAEYYAELARLDAVIAETIRGMQEVAKAIGLEMNTAE